MLNIMLHYSFKFFCSLELGLGVRKNNSKYILIYVGNTVQSLFNYVFKKYIPKQTK